MVEMKDDNSVVVTVASKGLNLAARWAELMVYRRADYSDESMAVVKAAWMADLMAYCSVGLKVAVKVAQRAYEKVEYSACS